MNDETDQSNEDKSQYSKHAEDFLTIRQYTERYPWPSESGFRWMLFHSATNGLETAIIRVGRRIIIDTEAFKLWVKGHRRDVK